MRTVLSKIMVAGVSLLCVVEASAADWPRWRGADFSDISVETGLLKKWPEGGPKKLWSTEEAGLGYSGYAVAGGVLYTMGLKEDMELLLAFDSETGKPKWSTPVGPILKNKWGDGPRATPTVDGERVYAMSGQGYLICVNAADGTSVWSVEMKSFGGKIPGWGYTESVLVDGDKVICMPGGEKGALVALNKATGEKIWQTGGWTDAAQYSSAIAADLNGVRQIIALTMQHVGGVDARSGSQLWLSDWQGKTAVIPTPIHKGNEVFVSSGYGVGCKQVRIAADNSVSDVWTNTNMINHHGGVILYKDHLFGYSDKAGWSCLDWKTGEVKWADKSLGKGAIHCADGMFYLLEESSGVVALIEASAQGSTERARFKIDPQTTQRKPDGRVWTHPVVSNGRLYLRDQELIYCYDVRAGK
jgi:outer membrane protein assembly factor BamB